MTWFRHSGDAKFHAGAPSDGSFITLCRGRWPLIDVAYGEVEANDNPAPADRCGACVSIAAERGAVHTLVDNLLALNEIAGPPDALNPEWCIRLAREVVRQRQELETRANELRAAERSLVEAQEINNAIALADVGIGGEKYGSALVEALGIAEAAGRRGLLSVRDKLRLRELAKVVPQ